MNLKIIIKLLSILSIIICISLLIPAFMALWLNEAASLKAFFMTISITTVISAVCYKLTARCNVENLKPRDSFIFVTLSWVIASAIGAMPYYFSNSVPSFTDAYFETMSGFTTTGASILTSPEALSFSMQFWRGLTHWLGGMGIVVLAVAILPFLGIGGMQLLEAEAPGPTVDKITPRIAETAKILWLIYIGLTVLQTIFLLFGGMSLYDSLFHTFATVATGGFSCKNLSVGHYNSAYIDYVITIFTFFAAVNFTLHYKIITGKFRSVFYDVELRTFLLIVLTATAIISFNTYGPIYNSVSDCVRYASFQVVTIISTTGFSTADYEKWPQVSQNVIFFLMFIGGCAGSTSGGIKVIRLVTLLKQAMIEMKSLIHPRGVFALKVGENVVKAPIANAVSGFFFLYIAAVLIITFIVSTNNNDILTSITATLATLGNIGPGLGLVGPTDNYSFLAPYVKWTLSFAMLIGRLELYTVLVLFTPYFWKR
ncbi:MAG: potassium transporter TrkG [Candidatus Wallbacteria bacterium]